MHTERIVSITEVGIKDTRDLIVPETNNFFLANGILCHNSGKTYATIYEALLIDPEFTLDNLVFTTQEYLNVIKTIKKGEVILWDETGASLGNREFATKMNRNISKIFQTQRYLNFAGLMTTPSLNLIDKQPRDLLNSVVVMKRIIKSYNISIARIYDKRADPISGKTFNVLPRVSVGNTTYKIRDFAFSLPPKKILKEYEERKDDFFRKNVLDKAIQEQEAEDESIYGKVRSAEIEKNSVDESMKKVLAEPFHYGKMKGGVWKLEARRIQALLNINKETASKVKFKSEFVLGNGKNQE